MGRRATRNFIAASGTLLYPLLHASAGGHPPEGHAFCTFPADIIYLAGDSPRSVAVGDLDGDADPDLAVANSATRDVSVLLQDCRLRRCLGDLDGDGAVGFTDLVQVLSYWGPCPACDEDLDEDDRVGLTDLLRLLANWGPCRS